ncbi:MAG: hypothetical protein V2J20_04930 [Wenzhouxiangella sp.]|jgi:hypothetical protein|nr:hypothetical protein [Wenzhouxiangella sp.]
MPNADTATAQLQPQRFFANTALLLAMLVFLSFPLTYYLPVVTGTHSFQLLYHVHGLACFAWIGLLAWQARLVAQGNIARHRELGLSGFALSGALILSGYWMAQRGGENRLAQGVAQPWEFTYFNLVDISLFALLVIGAIVLVTRHVDWHRRLIYIAALCLVAPALTRWTLKLPLANSLLVDLLSYVLVTIPFLIALGMHDRRVLGRIHAATLTGAALVLPLQLSSPWVARSDWWNGFAPALMGSG